MKIAVLAHSLFPIAEPFAGGLEMITYLLCSALQERGHELHLYTHPESDDRFHIVPLSPTETEKHFNLDSVAKYLAESSGIDRNFIYESAVYSKALNQIAQGDYDIVHNHSLHHFPITMGNMMEVPFITSFHTPPFPFLQMGTVSVKGMARQTFTTVSKKLGETWSEFIDDYEVVYNGIDVSKWSFSAKTTSKQAFWSGRICEEKAPHHAILAAKKLGIKLDLAGPKSNQDYYDEFVAPHLDENIQYVGHLNQSEVKGYLSRACVSFFTSIWEEPYGLVLAESLACGTPVVAYDVGAAAEILTSETGVLVEAEDIDGLAEGFDKACSLSRKACRERAEDFCSAEQMVDSYVRLYEKKIKEYQRKVSAEKELLTL